MQDADFRAQRFRDGVVLLIVGRNDDDVVSRLYEGRDDHVVCAGTTVHRQHVVGAGRLEQRRDGAAQAQEPVEVAVVEAGPAQFFEEGLRVATRQRYQLVDRHRLDAARTQVVGAVRIARVEPVFDLEFLEFHGSLQRWRIVTALSKSVNLAPG